MEHRRAFRLGPLILASAAMMTVSCSSDPSPQQQVREAADEYFGEGTWNQSYVTGAAQMCFDLDAGESVDQALAGTLPPVYKFYVEIAGPIMCPDHF